ncbi:MAG: TraB/GumN family protein [Bacteroidota bacterium]
MSARFLLLTILISFFSWQVILGQINDLAPVIEDLHAEPIEVQQTPSILWKVEGRDLSEPSYVYAILYKVPDDYFFLPAELSGIVSNVSQLVMEVDPMDIEVDHLHRGATPLDSTLEALMPKRRYEALETFIKDSLSQIARYKLESRYAPLVLMRQLFADYCVGWHRGHQPIAYEVYLARAVELPLKTLNTGWTRTAWLDGYDFAEQANMLQDAMDRRQYLCENYWAMLRAYRSQDLDRLWILCKDVPDLGDNMNQFIEARNAEWMERLPELLRRNSSLVAVNAAQLPGEYGLLHQLRKAGYTVEPIQVDSPPNQQAHR